MLRGQPGPMFYLTGTIEHGSGPATDTPKPEPAIISNAELTHSDQELAEDYWAQGKYNR